jgi:hypothetical protein
LEIKIQIISPKKNGVASSMILQIKHLMKSKLGRYYIWYTGPSCIGGELYTIGISNDDPDVVKGRAGSPTLLRIITMLILISLLVQQIG